MDVALYNGCGIKLENLKGIRKLNSKIGGAKEKVTRKIKAKTKKGNKKETSEARNNQEI